MRLGEKVAHSRVNAQAALDAYRRAAVMPDPDDAGAIGDLIVDLLHLAEATGIEPALVEMTVSDVAASHYLHESNPDNHEEEV